MATQKRHSATFKSSVVLAMLKEEKTVTQIAVEYGIHLGNCIGGNAKPWTIFRYCLWIRGRSNSQLKPMRNH